MNDIEITELMAYVAAGWPNWRMPEGRTAQDATARFWRDQLGDVDARAALAAVATVAREGAEFAPTAGEIARRAIGMSVARIPDLDEAWGEVMGRARAGFRQSSIGFSHPAIDEVVAILSWWNICYGENQAALYAQFRDTYNSSRERTERERIMPPAAREIVDGLASKLSAKRRELGA